MPPQQVLSNPSLVYGYVRRRGERDLDSEALTVCHIKAILVAKSNTVDLEKRQKAKRNNTRERGISVELGSHKA